MLRDWKYIYTKWKKSCECPLKPMPEKYTDLLSYDSDTFERGWNDCIDEILGENE